jgi:hypothetical protein
MHIKTIITRLYFPPLGIIPIKVTGIPVFFTSFLPEKRQRNDEGK